MQSSRSSIKTLKFISLRRWFRSWNEWKKLLISALPLLSAKNIPPLSLSHTQTYSHCLSFFRTRSHSHWLFLSLSLCSVSPSLSITCSLTLSLPFSLSLTLYLSHPHSPLSLTLFFSLSSSFWHFEKRGEKTLSLLLKFESISGPVEGYSESQFMFPATTFPRRCICSSGILPTSAFALCSLGFYSSRRPSRIGQSQSFTDCLL